MGRPKGDPRYWTEVTIIEENKKWKCNHCMRTFGGGFSRIKAHLDKIQGKGIALCSSVYGDNEGVHNIITSSSIDPQVAINTLNPLEVAGGAREMIGTIGGSINHQTTSFSEEDEWTHEMIVNGSIDLQNSTQSTALLGGCVAEHGVNGSSNGNSDTLTTSQSELNELVSELTREEEDVKGQFQWLESRGKKRKSRVDVWLNELRDLKKRAVDMDRLEDLILKWPWVKKKKPVVLQDEIVGKNFETNVKEMWDLLEDDKVFVIGIHGMGGVGKTFLATYMENEIKRKGTFKHVFWVTVSHDFTIFKLQQRIAERMGVKLYGDDERAIATILESELVKIEKSVLILDDVWKYVDLEKLGIHLKVNGIKLIITTRLKHVCQQMDCLPHNMIEMHPLSVKEEALKLFLLKLGHHGTPATLPPQVLDIAISIVEKCSGLPLGISVMARTMKGENDIRWWRHALNKLENLEMEGEVLTALKRSYDNLTEKDMQKCFLYCALLPCTSERNYLVTELVMNVLLNGKKSLGEIFDEGHIIVDKLIQHSLLLRTDDDDLDMYGLVRNMACHIMNHMVKCNKNLKKIPHVREWTIDLKAVSLVNNRIEEIPEGISPNCPRLSTLILSHNHISHIPECFFTHMNALAVLDLSYNHRLTCLPNSLSNLRCLTSLVLRRCSKLEYIPPLGELQALSRLDISSCSILQVPQGLQNLINLKWLDLYNNVNLTLAPGIVLPGLTNLQYLDLRCSSGIQVEDVKGMSMLECFGGSFIDQDNYNRYVQEIQDTGYGPGTYLIRFGIFKKGKPSIDEDPIYSKLYRRSVRFGDCEELSYLLPKDLAELIVKGNNQWVCLCCALSSNGSPCLKKIYIDDCTKLKSLFCLSCSCSLCTNIQNFESLYPKNLKSLTAICKEDIADLPQSLSRNGMFSHLKYFDIWECHEIETLLTPELVPQLQNLESITVFGCNSMKEIFAASNRGDDDSFEIALPKLTTLNLFLLPQLETVCKGTLVCGSEQILDKFHYCPKLERPRIRGYVT